MPFYIVQLFRKYITCNVLKLHACIGANLEIFL